MLPRDLAESQNKRQHTRSVSALMRSISAWRFLLSSSIWRSFSEAGVDTLEMGTGEDDGIEGGGGPELFTASSSRCLASMAACFCILSTSLYAYLHYLTSHLVCQIRCCWGGWCSRCGWWEVIVILFVIRVIGRRWWFIVGLFL